MSDTVGGVGCGIIAKVEGIQRRVLCKNPITKRAFTIRTVIAVHVTTYSKTLPMNYFILYGKYSDLKISVQGHKAILHRK